MEAGTRIAGKYLRGARLGAGAAGSVWAATNELTGRKVALKVLHGAGDFGDEARDRLLREARACGRIHHKNVVEIYDVGAADDGSPFLVMQLLHGETLEQKLRREGPLPGAVAGGIAVQVASGLAAAHRAGIVHRDLKPANLFLHRGPREHEGETVKILDFGVSKILESVESSHTVTGNPLGSPAYMAPEQARGEGDVDAKSDLWALGIVVFEMVTGAPPFLGHSIYEVVAAIVHRDVPRLAARLPGVDPRLDALVQGCLLRERSARIDAEQAAALLEGFATIVARERSFSIPNVPLALRLRDGVGPGGTLAMSPPTAPRAVAHPLATSLSDLEITRDLRLGARPLASPIAAITTVRIEGALRRRRLTRALAAAAAGLAVGAVLAAAIFR